MNDTVVIGGNQRLRNTISGQANLRNAISGAPNSSIRVVGSKFDENGTYPNLTAGNILSDNYDEDSTPYLFRQSGGGVRVGTKEEDTIVGGSIVWNQMANALNSDNWSAISLGAVSASFSDGIATFTASATNGGIQNAADMPIVNGHKYLMLGNVKFASVSTKLQIYLVSGLGLSYGNVSHTAGDWIDITYLASATASSNTARIRCRDVSTSDWSQIQVKNLMLFDLTQMFGSTVADYIYALETATTGAGVAYFRSLFPKPYYAYNAGELVHVSGLTRHDTTGKNLLPSDAVEIGSYSSTGGEIQSGNDAYRRLSINLSAGTYTFSSNTTDMYIIRVLFDNVTINRNATFTLSEYANVKIAWRNNTTTSITETLYNQVEFGTTATAYEPYIKHTYPLDSTLTLRGIPKVANNKMYFDGDTYASDGTVTRKYGIRPYQSGDESLADSITGGNNTVYKLTTSTTETATGYTNPQEVDADGTEEYVITTTADVAVPVGHVTKYPADSKQKLDGLPWDFSTLIAPTEKTFKATRAYTAKQFLIVNNQLYKVTASIANGANITVGTNVVATTIGEVLTSLL